MRFSPLLSITVLALAACSGQGAGTQTNQSAPSILPKASVTQASPFCSVTDANAYQAGSGDSVTDAWAEGYNSMGSGISGPPNELGHFNNGTWTNTSVPGSDVLNNFSGLKAVGPNDAWTTAQFQSSTDGLPPYAVFYRWNGSAWIQHQQPAQFAHIPARAIAGDSANDVYFADVDSGGHLLLARWNGSTISFVARAPYAGMSVSDIVVFSSTNVYVLLNSSGAASVAHWNGSTFAFHTLPNEPGMSAASAVQFSAVASTDIWAIGSNAIWHYNGTWQPYLYQTSAGQPVFSGIAAFRSNYVIATGAINGVAVAYVYDGVNRFRPVTIPIQNLSGGPNGGYSLLSVNHGTTSFWANYIVYIGPTDSQVGLVTCAPNPPPNT